MTAGQLGASDLDALRGQVAGGVTGPGDPGWDEARRAWNLSIDQRPAAVAEVGGTAEVQAAVKLARERGLGVSVQAIGHGAMSSLEGVLLLKTRGWNGFELDTAAATAKVSPGTTWGELHAQSGPAGLAGLPGTGPEISITGYTLGGGISWLGRKYGLAATSVRAAEIVTGDGDVLTVDADNEPDLFWALRGGGGGFGVVTSLTIGLFPAPELFAGMMFFPVERAPDVLPAWRAWVDTVPDEVTSLVNVLNLPPLPFIPEPLRGRSFLAVGACVIGSREFGEELIRPLRELGGAVVDSFAPTPLAQLGLVHGDPLDPSPSAGRASFLSALDPATVDRIAAEAVASQFAPLVTVEIRHLGGAIAREAPGEGATGHYEEPFLFMPRGAPFSPELAAAMPAALDRAFAPVAGVATGGAPLSWVEEPDQLAGVFRPDTLERLLEVKRRYDPGNRYRGNHPLGFQP
jgi:FAD/FMN-containing dehydrogenase